jgi:hypothetical protein
VYHTCKLSLPVLNYISRSPGGSSKSPSFHWNPNKQILPNLPNWVWIIGFISGWVLSHGFFSVASQRQCQLPNPGNCNRVWVWDWANLMVTKSKYKQRHRRRGQQIEQWPDLELFKSHLTLMTAHWKQSNTYLGAMPTPCLLLTLLISFLVAPRIATIPYYRPPYTFRSCRAKLNLFTYAQIMPIHTSTLHMHVLKFIYFLLSITIWVY